jgi:2'-hydroxyisoflavone reductase
MKTLILGGTTFLGRHLVRTLARRGHETAIFTRGNAPGDETADVTRYVGDRDGGLAAIPRDGWDAVIDTSGYVPGVVAASCAHLASAGRYLFTSSISVYDASGPVTGDGVSPYVPHDPACADDDPKNYGSSKRRCEDVVRAVFDERATIVRPGLLVGPYDPTNRFTYWVDRFAAGGEIAVPGPPDRFVQFIDVRDAADFMIHLCETGRSGIYDVTGEPQTTTIEAFVATARATLASADATLATADATLATAGAIRAESADVRWIAEPFLEAHGVTGWMDLPLWIGPAAGLPGLMNARVDRARADGLVFRPLATTIADTHEWSRAERPSPSTSARAGITRDRERELLAAWAAASEAQTT